MNTAHAPEEGMKEIIKNVRAVSSHIALMIDTKGPEIRTTGVAEPIEYKSGEIVKIFGRPEMDTTHDILNVSYPDICQRCESGRQHSFRRWRTRHEGARGARSDAGYASTKRW